MKAMNYYGKELNAYRAALHTHSTTSDGSFTPEEMIGFYAAKGYEIYAFTDHSTANPVSTYDGRGMTLISGMEIHPEGPRGVPWHLLALGVPEDFQTPVKDETTTIQECIDAVNAVGGLAYIAHPSWCGIRSTDLMPLKGVQGLEVYNGDTRFAGKSFNMTQWNEISDMGILWNALAVDDAHTERDFFSGWTMVLTDKPLSQATVIEALRAGQSYCTQGPEFKSITLENDILEAEFSPCIEAIGISFSYRGYCGMTENLTSFTDGFQEVTHFSAKLKHDIPNALVRLQIKDRQGHYAWSNPIKIG